MSGVNNQIESAANSTVAEDAALTSGSKGMVVLTKRTDTAASSAGADGDAATLNTDANGSLWVVESTAPMYEDGTNGVAATAKKPVPTNDYTWSHYISSALEKSAIVSADPACIRRIYCRIDASYATDDVWLQVYNSATLPADGAVTHLCLPRKKIHTMVSDTVIEIDFGEQGRYASNGIVVALSTTEFTKTLVGSSVVSFDVEYIA